MDRAALFQRAFHYARVSFKAVGCLPPLLWRGLATFCGAGVCEGVLLASLTLASLVWVIAIA